MFRLIRDSDVEINEEAEDLVLLYESALKRRRRGDLISISVNSAMPAELRDFLFDQLEIPAQTQTVHVFHLDRMLNIGDVEGGDRRRPARPQVRALQRRAFPSASATSAATASPPSAPRTSSSTIPTRASTSWCSSCARRRAIRPWWRSSRRSTAPADDLPIVKELIAAAEAGKTVTALVELKARFDEEANIRWARDLERAGVQVVYGFIDLKTHAKVSMVVRREAQAIRTYVHFGTGNYHPITARIYTDLSFFTCDPAMGRDAARLFNYMTGYARPEQMEKIAFAPVTPAARRSTA